MFDDKETIQNYHRNPNPPHPDENQHHQPQKAPPADQTPQTPDQSYPFKVYL